LHQRSFVVRLTISSLVLIASFTSGGFSSLWTAPEARAAADGRGTAEDADRRRAEAIARAEVWTPTDVATMDIRTGPERPDGFSFMATVTCDYLPKRLSGASPKFACRLGDEDELKVKYGRANAEVYAEVAATRLLWALGFGADDMYPVRVICRGCPATPERMTLDYDDRVFDPAAIERKLPGREFPGEEGWKWNELDAVNPEVGGAPQAHRDALKLLAVFLQHTDSKREQQRLLCRDETDLSGDTGSCGRPLMMINDLGLTFGRADKFNSNEKGMHLVDWSSTPVWKGDTGCVGNLPKSLTGTLDDPVISEAGRQFLAGLLGQLSDAQIQDLFETARVTLRPRDPQRSRSGAATVDEWVSAFKDKRRQIAERTCP
jgi:hypothetical protein